MATVDMRKLNWREDPNYHAMPQHKPLMLAAAAPLPAETDLEPLSPAVYDQGGEGSCTIHAVYGVFHIKEKIEGNDKGKPAMLFGYQMELKDQGTWGQDAGSTIPTGMKVAITYGMPPDSLYPYTDDKTKLSVMPPSNVFMAGEQRKATAAMEVAIKNDHDHIVAMLAAKAPIACGFQVPKSFMSQTVAKTGVWGGQMRNDPIVGGHAIAIVGHSDARKAYKIRNSWSAKWGLNGYVWVPMAFVHAHFRDLMAVVDAPA